MIIDFSFILVAALLITGVVWAADALLWRPKRPVAADGQPAQEPVIVEYARSFFPVILIVVVIRSFLLEPFRIPSDSMMPTLLDGDFIFVNKFAYGLRLPVANAKIMSIGDPQRGDVVVFRLPSDPATNYIKRLVGLPGDHVVVRNNRISVNGIAMAIQPDGFYTGQGYSGSLLGKEKLGEAVHNVLITQDRYATDFEATVPAGHYFFMGDNRNNSQDSRFPQVGFVPDKNLVGRADRIWMHWRWRELPKWSRIGQAID